MKPAIRYQSQLLYRRSYKPQRTIRIRPTRFPGPVRLPAPRRSQ